jgi:hypothetical protein
MRFVCGRCRASGTVTFSSTLSAPSSRVSASVTWASVAPARSVAVIAAMVAARGASAYDDTATHMGERASPHRRAHASSSRHDPERRTPRVPGCWPSAPSALGLDRPARLGNLVHMGEMAAAAAANRVGPETLPRATRSRERRPRAGRKEPEMCRLMAWFGQPLRIDELRGPHHHHRLEGVEAHAAAARRRRRRGGGTVARAGDRCRRFSAATYRKESRHRSCARRPLHAGPTAIERGVRAPRHYTRLHDRAVVGHPGGRHDVD